MVWFLNATALLFALLYAQFPHVSIPLHVAVLWWLSSWLGACVFVDGSQNRRVPNPESKSWGGMTLAWLSQFATPLTSLMVWGYVVVALVQLKHPHSYSENTEGAATFLPALLGGMALAFLAGAWISQWMKRTWITLVVAPVASAIALGGASFYLSGIERNPLWLIPSLLGLVWSTRTLMNSWTTDQMHVRSFLRQLAVLVLAGETLALPLLLAWSGPAMSASVRASLLKILKSSPSNEDIGKDRGGKPFVLKLRVSNIPFDPVAENGTQGFEDASESSNEQSSPRETKKSLREIVELDLESIEDAVQNHEQNFSIDFRVLALLGSETLLSRNALPPLDEQEKPLQRYRRIMRLNGELVQRLRTSTRVDAQENADRIELLVVQELLLPRAKDRLGDELFSKLVAHVSDSEYRDQQRLIALAVAWNTPLYKEGASQKAMYDIGGTKVPNLNSLRRRTWVEHLRCFRTRDYAVETLYMYLMSKDRDKTSPAFQQYANVFHVQRNEGEIVLVGSVSRMGAFWNGDWETAAQSLVAHSNSDKFPDASLREGDELQ